MSPSEPYTVPPVPPAEWAATYREALQHAERTLRSGVELAAGPQLQVCPCLLLCCRCSFVCLLTAFHPVSPACPAPGLVWELLCVLGLAGLVGLLWLLLFLLFCRLLQRMLQLQRFWRQMSLMPPRKTPWPTLGTL